MECNVLGSGPSRKSYVPNNLPSMGCNIPWTKVDYLIISDEIVMEKICLDDMEIDFKLILSEEAHSYLTKNNLLSKYENKIDSIFQGMRGLFSRKSCGHYACLTMISKGFTKLNIYGCDNYFGDNICLDNWVHNKENPHYISENSEFYGPRNNSQVYQRGLDWKKFWNQLIKKYPNVEFNFIK